MVLRRIFGMNEIRLHTSASSDRPVAPALAQTRGNARCVWESLDVVGAVRSALSQNAESS
jgi:hypothetical protein